MNRNLKRYKRYPVHLTWIDSKADRGWTYEPDPDPATIETLGWLVSETDTAVVVSTSLADCGSRMDPLTIPKCAIIRRRKVKL